MNKERPAQSQLRPQDELEGIVPISATRMNRDGGGFVDTIHVLCLLNQVHLLVRDWRLMCTH